MTDGPTYDRLPPIEATDSDLPGLELAQASLGQLSMTETTEILTEPTEHISRLESVRRISRRDGQTDAFEKVGEMIADLLEQARKSAE